MNLLVFRNHVVALLAFATLLVGSTFFNPAYAGRVEARRHKSSRDSSCCKSVKKHLKKAVKTLGSIEKRERKKCCEAKPICQKTINKAGGVLVLRNSGNYALTEDVTGTIALAADSICLDLCCHTLSAGGRANAVVTSGFQDIEVFNGRIVNASDAAILVTNSSAVELYDLVMSNNSLDAIRETNSTDLSVHNVDFVGDVSGERALLFDTCDNISVSRCNASGFLSTVGAVIEINRCNTVEVQDVDVTNCTKTSAADAYFFTAPTALVFVGGPGIPSVDTITGCTGVHFERVRVNNNTFNNTVAVSDPDNIGFNWRTAEAIHFLSVSSFSLTDCETSFNVDIAGALATEDTEDYIFCMLGSDNGLVNGFQANANSCSQPISAFQGITGWDTQNIKVTNSQACENVVSELNNPGFQAAFIGIGFNLYFGGGFDVAFTLNEVRNSQANSNIVMNSGAGRQHDFERAFLIAFENHTTGLVENCQGSFNAILDRNPFTTISGCNFTERTGVGVISNCIFDHNTGGAEAIGISTSSFKVNNIRIINTSASFNGNYGIANGSLVDTELDQNLVPSGNIEIINCIFDSNGPRDDTVVEGANPNGAGIFVSDKLLGTKNIVIRGCDILDTFSAQGDSAGITVTNATNVVVEDTNVFTSVATADTGSAYGIIFDSLSDSKIIRTQVHGNQNGGIELIGDNSDISIIECVAKDNGIGFEFASGSTASCCLVQDSRALSNRVAGFVYAATPTPFTVTFIGNEAQCNGDDPTTDNYALGGNNIPLQSLSWSTGISAQVGATTAVLGSRIANTYMIP